MKYKLYTDIKYDSPIEQVLRGRGIENVKEWIGANSDCIEGWSGLYNMRQAVSLVKGVIDHNGDTVIIVDCDVDGYTSSAIFINFMYSLYPDWINSHVTYLQHKGKEHGLADMINEIPEKTELIICPDSASNDYEQHEFFVGKSDILILDHHEADHISMSINTVTVNNQLCNYKNKMLSGAGIVWQFCKAYNEIYNLNGKIDTDLCALGLISDMMSYHSLETKAIIQEGLSNISNPFFYQMTQDNQFTLNKYGGLGYKAIAYAVTPFINATVRSGTAEEKDIVFKAMCKPWCFEQVPNTKRGHKGEQWPLYQQAAYLTSTIKRRQTKLETESMALLEKKISINNLLDNSILVCCCDPGEVEPNIRGLAANKLASKYQRPCLVLTKSKTKDDTEYFYRGSGRNYGMSEIADLKELEESTGLIEYAQGHGNAHGFGIAEVNLDNFVKIMNEKLKDSIGEPVYWVDYIWNQTTASPDKLLELANMCGYWGQDIPASQVCIKDINLSQCQMRLCGPKNDTLRIVLPNGLVLVKFQLSEDDFDMMCKDNTIMTCIVNPQKNEWQGKVSGEGIIEDFELETKWIF